jgi:hypothetical protein
MREPSSQTMNEFHPILDAFYDKIAILSCMLPATSLREIASDSPQNRLMLGLIRH